MRAWLLLLLLTSVVAQAPGAYDGQARDEASVHAPVQVVVDAVPAVVASAVVEGEDDGTPDDALALVQKLTRFLQGLDDVPGWSDRTVAGQIDVRASYHYTRDLVAVLEKIPQEVGRLARTEGSCAAWAANASVGEYRRWVEDSVDASASLAVFGSLLGQLADASPPQIDARPLYRAAEMLSAWNGPRSEATYSCLDKVEVRLVAAGLLGPDEGLKPYLRAFLVPTTAYTTQPVRLVAHQSGLAGPLRVTGAHQSEVPFEAGLAVVSFAAPAPGNHAYVATVADRSVELGLEVTKAPVQLLLSGDRRVRPGQAIHVEVHAVTPAALPVEGEVRGDHLMTLVEGRARFVFSLEEGRHTLRFTYPGSHLLDPAQAQWTVVVAPPSTVIEAPSETTEEKGPSLWDRFLRGLPVLPKIPVPPWTFLLVLVGLLAMYGLWEQLHRRRVVFLSTPVVPVRFRLPPGLVAAFAAIVDLLVRRGKARRSMTAREVGRLLPGSKPVVRRFEEARYGKGQDEADEDTRRRFQEWSR